MKLITSGALALSAILAVSPLDLGAQTDAQKETPKGWVGVLITTGIGQANSAGTLVFPDYPVIESIDPGSPAEKAGLRAGDILVSINRQDFKMNPIPMNELLTPGRTIVFRYRRDNVPMISRLIVGERPAGTTPGIDVRISAIQELPRAGDRRATEDALNRQVRIRERIPVAPNVLVAPLVFGSGTPSIAVAGAELTQLNNGLREALNLKGSGVFVVNVPPGAPAFISGLRSGDVIVRASKQIVENPGQLIRLMIEATENSIPLQIMRKQKAKSLVLSW